MQRLLAFLAILPLTAATVPSQGHAGIALIVNKDNRIERLSPSKVRVIFLRNISRWPWGAEITPVDLPDSNPVRQEFLHSMIGWTPAQMEVYWIDQKISKSVDRPVRAASVREAKTLVASHPGAIAYIPSEDVDATVRVVEVK